MTLHCGSHEELIDVFLGLKQNVPVSNLTISENRFDIKLPSTAGTTRSGEMTLNPGHHDECTITFRRKRLSQPSVFTGTVVFAPRQISGNGRIDGVIKTEFSIFVSIRNR